MGSRDASLQWLLIVGREVTRAYILLLLIGIPVTVMAMLVRQAGWSGSIPGEVVVTIIAGLALGLLTIGLGLHVRSERRRRSGREVSVRLLLWETVVFDAIFKAGALLSVLALLGGVPVAQVVGSWTLPISWTLSWMAAVTYGLATYYRAAGPPRVTLPSRRRIWLGAVGAAIAIVLVQAALVGADRLSLGVSALQGLASVGVIALLAWVGHLRLGDR